MKDLFTAKYRDVLEYITVKQKVSVSELSSVFFLSESTVRRVLRQLEKNDFIERYYGGAVIKGIDAHTLPIENRTRSMSRQKAAIASEAASYVQDDMTVILLGGTTVHAMCQYLKGRKLTIITSSIPVVNATINEPNIKVILLGGVVNPLEYEVRGSMTKAALERLRADQLYVGATNIHEHHGLMTNDPDAVDAYRTCMAAADRTFLLADSTKFRPGGAAVVASLNELDDLITDDSIQEETLQIFKNSDIRVHVAKCKL